VFEVSESETIPITAISHVVILGVPSHLRLLLPIRSRLFHFEFQSFCVAAPARKLAENSIMNCGFMLLDHTLQGAILSFYYTQQQTIIFCGSVTWVSFSGEQILVFEYVANGSLADHICGKDFPIIITLAEKFMTH
jgi:hypothetical protein